MTQSIVSLRAWLQSLGCDDGGRKVVIVAEDSDNWYIRAVVKLKFMAVSGSRPGRLFFF
jgi:hypothetical protein